MTSRPATPSLLRTAVLAFVLAVATSLFLVRESAVGTQDAGTGAPADITVVGDSITANYDDEPGSDMQGWWSIVGRHYDVPVTRYAQSGSGYLKLGRQCRGTRFASRPAAVLPRSPSMLILEGGRNDWSYCTRDGLPRRAPDAMIAHAVDSYMDAVERAVQPRTRVVVLGPIWGPLQHEESPRVTAIVEQAARAHDFEFIATEGVLTSSSVLDGIHPSRAGSERIAERVLAGLER